LNYVLDASAMVAYLEGEPGAAVVASILADPTAICYAHSMNLCEVNLRAFVCIVVLDYQTAGTSGKPVRKYFNKRKSAVAGVVHPHG
jgi:uncharacterized protein with PIN domain